MARSQGGFKRRFVPYKKRATKRKYSVGTRKPTRRVYKRRPKRKAPSATKKYATACFAPFSGAAVGAAVPSFPNRDSQKAHHTTTGTFLCNADGYAFVAMAPTLANDVAEVFHSKQDYDASPSTGWLDNDSSATINLSASESAEYSSYIPSNGSHSKAELIVGSNTAAYPVSGRIVTAGLRVRYIGPDDTTQGLVYAYASPSHFNQNGRTFSAIANERTCVKVPVSKQWTEITTLGVHSDELEYPRLYADKLGVDNVPNSAEVVRRIYPFSCNQAMSGENADDQANQTTRGGAPLVIMVQGAGDRAAFEWESITHCEYVGAAVATVATKTPMTKGDSADVVSQEYFGKSHARDGVSSWTALAMGTVGTIGYAGASILGDAIASHYMAAF